MFRRGFLCVRPVNDFSTDSVPSRLQWGCFPSALAAAGLERPQVTVGQLKRLGLWGAGGGRTDFSCFYTAGGQLLSAWGSLSCVHDPCVGNISLGSVLPLQLY